jgi:hypothetical protein
MDDIQERSKQAQALWSRGDASFQTSDLAESYRLYTEAHDLVTDCPSLHKRAHQKLAAVNRLNGRRGELFTDQFLLATAPLGIFTVIPWFFRSRVTGDVICKKAV